jgi:copper oxidase (laccase) domain-containing protein
VDEEFRARFEDADADNSRFFVPGPAGKPHFDLPSYVLHRLMSAGIGYAEALGLDTYADAGRFYSYRRSTHLGEPSYGRQISMIGLAPKS